MGLTFWSCLPASRAAPAMARPGAKSRQNASRGPNPPEFTGAFKNRRRNNYSIVFLCLLGANLAALVLWETIHQFGRKDPSPTSSPPSLLSAVVAALSEKRWPVPGMPGAKLTRVQALVIAHLFGYYVLSMWQRAVALVKDKPRAPLKTRAADKPKTS